MFKVVITGPESTGKSTITRQLANFFNIDMVKEHSRSYLEKLERPYVQNDLTAIAKGQIAIEDEVSKAGSKFIICDTSLEVIKIWSEFKYDSCDSFIIDEVNNRLPDLYLLMMN